MVGEHSGINLPEHQVQLMNLQQLRAFFCPHFVCLKALTGTVMIGIEVYKLV